MIGWFWCLPCLFSITVWAGIDGNAPESLKHDASGAKKLSELTDSELLYDFDGAAAESLAMHMSLQDTMQSVHSTLEQWGLMALDVCGDGDCQFSALVISGNLDMSNLDLRTKVANHLGTHADRFRSFVDGCWQTYVNNVAQSGFWGDHITLVAAAEILGRPISLHSTLPGAGPVLIATTQEHQGQLPIVLVHHHEVHYQAVQEASAGVAGRLQYQSVRGLAAPEPLQEDGRCSCGWFLIGSDACLNPQCSKNTKGDTPDHANPQCRPDKRQATPKVMTLESRPLPPSGTSRPQGARGSSCPDPWSPAYSYGPSGEVLKGKHGNCFRPLYKMLRYPELLAMSEDQCKEKVLKNYGLLPPQEGRTCFLCHGHMKLVKWNGKEPRLRCGKCEHHISAEKAFTPLFNTMSTWKEYCCALFLYSAQSRIDQAVLLSTLSENAVSRLFAGFRDMVAWYAVHCNSEVEFETAEVDMNASVGHIDRASSGDKNVHKGRVFLLKERATKTVKIYTLDDQEVPKGTAANPESKSEVHEAISQTMRNGSIGSSNGSQGIRSEVLAAKVPWQYAHHGRKPTKQFTRLAIYSKADISDKLKAVGHNVRWA